MPLTPKSSTDVAPANPCALQSHRVAAGNDRRGPPSSICSCRGADIKVPMPYGHAVWSYRIPNRIVPIVMKGARWRIALRWPTSATAAGSQIDNAPLRKPAHWRNLTLKRLNGDARKRGAYRRRNIHQTCRRVSQGIVPRAGWAGQRANLPPCAGSHDARLGRRTWSGAAVPGPPHGPSSMRRAAGKGGACRRSVLPPSTVVSPSRWHTLARRDSAMVRRRIVAAACPRLDGAVKQDSLPGYGRFSARGSPGFRALAQ